MKYQTLLLYTSVTVSLQLLHCDDANSDVAIVVMLIVILPLW